MSQTMIDTNHNDLFDGLSSITAERRARELRAEAVAGFFSRALRKVGGAFAGIQATMERRRMVSELSQLDDRLLADVGLNRETLNADLMRVRPAPAGYHGPAITGASLNVISDSHPTPANTDGDTRRHVA